jgi:FkbM family methyltransferase
MLGEKLIYYLANYTLQHSFEKEILKLVKNEKKLTIFDVGCYRGVFTKTILNSIKTKKYKFYLFDINKKVKNYIRYLLKLKNIFYHEIALSSKNGKANYNYNTFFESAGSSLSNLVKNDSKWNFSRKLILKIFLLKAKTFLKYQVRTITLDKFIKKNRIKSIDILKVDIEGSEYDLFKGAKNLLKKNKIKIILVEIMDKKSLYKKKEKIILNMLKKRNFILVKKVNILSISLFSNIKGGDYLLINNKYAK